jgi:hypothetical protein
MRLFKATAGPPTTGDDHGSRRRGRWSRYGCPNHGQDLRRQKIVTRPITVGVYAAQLSLFNLLLMVGSGVAAYYLAKHDYPIAPLSYRSSWGR